MTFYATKEAATLTGATIRQLVFWDLTKLVSPSRRTGSGMRRYGPEDLFLVHAIVRLRAAGRSIQVIRGIVPALVRLLAQRTFPLAEARVVVTRDGLVIVCRGPLVMNEYAARDYTVISGADIAAEIAAYDQERHPVEHASPYAAAVADLFAPREGGEISIK